MKNTLWVLRVFGMSLLMAVLLGACAAEVVTQPEVRARVVAKAGEAVTLYAGEAKDSARLFCPGDELAVFRGPEGKGAAIGKVRVTSYSGEHHLLGVVTQGSVAKGDLVRKGSVACTVQSAPAPGTERGGMGAPKTR